MVTDISSKGIKIDNSVYDFPIKFSALQSHFGESRISNKSNIVYTWDNLGIYAFSYKDKDLIDSVSIQLVKIDSFDFIPSAIYSDAFTINGIECTKLKYPTFEGDPDFGNSKQEGYIKLGDNAIYLSFSKNYSLQLIELSKYNVELKIFTEFSLKQVNNMAVLERIMNPS